MVERLVDTLGAWVVFGSGVVALSVSPLALPVFLGSLFLGGMMLWDTWVNRV